MQMRRPKKYKLTLKQMLAIKKKLKIPDEVTIDKQNLDSKYNFMLAKQTRSDFFEPGEKGLTYIQNDLYKQDTLFNGQRQLGLAKELRGIDVAEIILSDKDTKECLTALFIPPHKTENEIDNFIAGASQGPLSTIPFILRTSSGIPFSDQTITIQQPDITDGRTSNYFQDPNTGEIFYRFSCNSFPITDNETEQGAHIIGYLNGLTEANFQLKQKEITVTDEEGNKKTEMRWGFELVDFRTDSKVIYEMLQGKIFPEEKIQKLMTTAETQLKNTISALKEEYKIIKKYLEGTSVIDDLLKMDVGTLNKKDISSDEVHEFSKKLKEFQSIKIVADLKKECDEYQIYLENIVENELKNVLKALEKSGKMDEARILRDDKLNYTGNDRIKKMLNYYIRDKNKVLELANNERLGLAVEKLTALKSLTKCLTVENIPWSEQVENFKEKFIHPKLQDTFSKSADTRTEKFLTAIRIALGIATLGLHSKITRGSFKFWQSQDKISSDRMAEKLDDSLGKKNKR